MKQLLTFIVPKSNPIFKREVQHLKQAFKSCMIQSKLITRLHIITKVALTASPTIPDYNYLCVKDAMSQYFELLLQHTKLPLPKTQIARTKTTGGGGGGEKQKKGQE